MGDVKARGCSGEPSLFDDRYERPEVMVVQPSQHVGHADMLVDYSFKTYTTLRFNLSSRAAARPRRR